MNSIPNPSLCMVFTFYCRKINRDFLPHIPNRTAELLDDNRRLHVIYFGYINEELLSDGIAASRIRFSRSRLVFCILRPFLLFFKLLVYGRKHNVSVVINANDHLNLIFLYPAVKLLGAAMVARVAGQGIFAPKLNPLKRINRWIKIIKEKLSLKSAHKIVVLSQSLKQSLLSRGADESKMCVIPQGVDTDRFHWNEGAVYPAHHILFVGRITRAKGIREALAAFCMVQADYPELTLDVYGSGEELPELKIRYRGHAGICFHGHRDSDSLYHVYEDADILLLPSYYEGLPNVVMEAMATGTAVIASQVGGIPELLEEGKCGCLVPPGDVGSVAAALRTVLGDDRLRSQMIRRARKRIETLYSLTRAKKSFKELLDAL